jgi:hypothetical protein
VANSAPARRMTNRPFGPLRLVIGLLVALLAAGCAASGAASDDDKRGGFYGGFSTGGTRP